jgi:hypothetical protein
VCACLLGPIFEVHGRGEILVLPIFVSSSLPPAWRDRAPQMPKNRWEALATWPEGRTDQKPKYREISISREGPTWMDPGPCPAAVPGIERRGSSGSFWISGMCVCVRVSVCDEMAPTPPSTNQARSHHSFSCQPITTPRGRIRVSGLHQSTGPSQGGALFFGSLSLFLHDHGRGGRRGHAAPLRYSCAGFLRGCVCRLTLDGAFCLAGPLARTKRQICLRCQHRKRDGDTPEQE